MRTLSLTLEGGNQNEIKIPQKTSVFSKSHRLSAQRIGPGLTRQGPQGMGARVIWKEIVKTSVGEEANAESKDKNNLISKDN